MQLARLDVLVIDDFAISQWGLLSEMTCSKCLMTNQLSVKAWNTYLDDPALADAILDRIVHSGYGANTDRCLNAGVRRKSNFLLPGDKLHGPNEASAVTGCEQLLRVHATARAAPNI